jgi:hypothetical protein
MAQLQYLFTKLKKRELTNFNIKENLIQEEDCYYGDLGFDVRG